MIVVDASALIAILDKEPDAALYAEAIAEADSPLISAATLLEVNIVMLNRHGIKAARMVDRLIKEAGFQVESFTAQQAELAREAYARYGKGQKSAGLNYGDCFSCALAKATGLPLLFKGQDFSKTDIMPVEIKN
ncbi:MAG TPA: type II toxin-antitoxin system VapC family toxin [Candidatus Binatia bacterium]|nr:type II toxin-antitoxin system VapC family toxin [Candidatus Binatia bacterium]